MDSGVIFRSLKKRELSTFMAKQLLYDYATHKIDSAREAAVAQALQESPELTKNLDDILYGMTYCHHLQKAKLSRDFAEQFHASPGLLSKLKFSWNRRRSDNNFRWALKAFGIGLILLAITVAVPWSKYLRLFLQRQHPDFFLTEVPKNGSYEVSHSSTAPIPLNSTPSYYATAELKVANPQFTGEKLKSLLPKLRASIEHQAWRKSNQGDLVPFLKLSIPSDQTEALFSELKSQGQLTWITPPSENEKRSKIFGMELWITKAPPQKGKAPAKDENGE